MFCEKSACQCYSFVFVYLASKLFGAIVLALSSFAIGFLNCILSFLPLPPVWEAYYQLVC